MWYFRTNVARPRVGSTAVVKRAGGGFRTASERFARTNVSGSERSAIGVFVSRTTTFSSFSAIALQARRTPFALCARHVRRRSTGPGRHREVEAFFGISIIALRSKRSECSPNAHLKIFEIVKKSLAHLCLKSALMDFEHSRGTRGTSKFRNTCRFSQVFVSQKLRSVS